MHPGEIYRSTEPREILIQIFQEKKDKNPRFSIRAWARKLGFKNPSYLAEVLRGRRALKPAFALRLSSSLDLPDDERRYFEAVAFFANAPSVAERHFYEAIVKRLQPERTMQELNADVSAQFRSWVYWILDEMVLLKDFREDPEYLAKRLGPDVTPHMIQLAIEDLLKVGLLRRSARGKLTRPQASMFPLSDQRRLKLLGTLKKNTWERKATAFIEQPLDEIFFRSVPMPIRKEDLPKLKAFFDKVVEDFRKLEAKSGSADEVFMLDIGFFKVTLGQGEERKEGAS